MPSFSTYTEYFQYSCPYYLAMGMPYDLYWNGDADAVKAFQKAHVLRQEQDNTKLWLQGLYILEAVAAVLSSGENPHRYPKKPYELTGKPAGEEEPNENDNKFAMAKLQEWMARNNRAIKLKQEREAKEKAEKESADAEKNSENAEKNSENAEINFSNAEKSADTVMKGGEIGG